MNKTAGWETILRSEFFAVEENISTDDMILVFHGRGQSQIVGKVIKLPGFSRSGNPEEDLQEIADRLYLLVQGLIKNIQTMIKSGGSIQSMKNVDLASNQTVYIWNEQFASDLVHGPDALKKAQRLLAADAKKFQELAFHKNFKDIGRRNASEQSLYTSVVKLAHSNPELRQYLVPVLKGYRKNATTFPSEEALKKYLEEHPEADKSKHKVDPGKGSAKKNPYSSPDNKVFKQISNYVDILGDTEINKKPAVKELQKIFDSKKFPSIPQIEKAQDAFRGVLQNNKYYQLSNAEIKEISDIVYGLGKLKKRVQ